jgi:photosystem II stability/assembly factor-like uncharacterized protein
MKILGWTLLSIVAISSGSATAEAQWIQTNGPDNGPVNCLASIGTKLFAGTDGGVFVSTDGGVSWIHPMSELWAWEVTRLAVMGTDLLAAPRGGGLHRSSNYGSSWISSSTGLGSVVVLDLAVLSSWIIAGTQGSGIYRSSDGGVNWSPANTGLSADTVTSLALMDTLLFAGTRGEVFRSSDHGENWLPMTPLPSGATVTALAAKDTQLFAGADSGRAFRSADQGITWVPIPTSLIYYNVTSFASLDSLLFVGTTYGLLRSTDNGGHWTALDMPRRVNALYTLGGNLLAGTINGLFRSTDRGESWTDGNSGMKNASVRAVVMDGTKLYVGTWGAGVFLSSDGGDSWECFLPSSSGSFSLAFTASDSYVGGVNHLFYSARGSTSWTGAHYGSTSGFVYALAARGDTVFAGTSNGGLFRTWHFGSSLYGFRQVGFKDTAVNSLVFDGRTLYAGTQMGVFSSTDDTNWTALNSGLTTLDTRALAFKGSYLFAGTGGGGVFRSTDHGANWTPVNNGLGKQDVLSFAVKDDNLFAGTWENGVFLSTDNGANWTGVSHVSTFDPWFRIPGVVHALAVDDTYLYAGERRTGLWRRPLSEMVTFAGRYDGELPRAFALQQNYPNPFNPTTAISYQLPVASSVRIVIYDLLGREVAVLVNERKAAGSYEVQFEASRLSSGVYLYRLMAGSFTQTLKMVAVK